MSNLQVARSIASRFVLIVVLVASSLGGIPVYAQNPGGGVAAVPPAPGPPAATIAAPTATAIPNSKENYEGDRVTFPVNMQVTVDNGKPGQNPSTHCLKAGTKLRGVGQSDPAKANFMVIACNPLMGFLGNRPPQDCNVLCDFDDLSPDASHPDGAPNPANNLKTGSTIQVSLTDIHTHPPNRYGLAYGGLVVPFKFQLTGNHQFTGSATVGPYLGYRFDTETFGFATTLAAFAGASNIAVSKTTTNSTTMKTSTSTDQIAGFGYGGTVMVEVKGGFQAGAVLGFDSVGSGQGFQYNNKPWLALELGYSFSQ